MFDTVSVSASLFVGERFFQKVNGRPLASPSAIHTFRAVIETTAGRRSVREEVRIARMQNKLCDVMKCLTTVAAGVLSGRDRKKKLETGWLFEVLLLDQQVSFGVRLSFVTQCPHVSHVTCHRAQT